MAESPLKRRKLSLTTYSVGENELEEVGTSLPNEPTTPTRRASYLSPTKASLGRSHPDLLAKSPKRGSLTEPRGRLLRQELLGSKKSADGQLSTPKTAPRLSHGALGEPAENIVRDGSNKDGFVEAITQSSRVTPVRQVTGKEQAGTTTRSPLKRRQAPGSVAGKHDYGGKLLLTDLDTLPVPTLVKRPNNLTRQPSETRNEPELPPTPVQLGVGIIPDRPRGLHTSSSVGSKTGSGRRRRRIRSGNGTTITSSPLKPKDRRPMSPLDFSDIEEVEHELAQEAPESDAGGPDDQSRSKSRHGVRSRSPDDLPADFHERQLELTNLRSQLQKLRANLDSLESLADKLQQGSNLAIDEAVIDLLGLGARNPEEHLQISGAHPSFIKDPAAYLKLCAPDSIRLGHETTTRQIQKRTKVVHIMRLTAPEPWVPSSFHLSFNVRIDAKNACIDQIIAAKPTNEWEHNDLRRWVESRLQSPLHQLDVSGIVWGTGQYFEACIKKAKLFRYLDKVYNRGINMEASAGLDESSSYEDASEASRYVPETQLLVSPQGADNTVKSRSNRGTSNSKQILVTYEIDFTWTGDTRTHVEISLTGASAKSQDHAREMFARLLPSVGVIKAFACVWDIMNFDEKQHETNAATGKQTNRLRKQ